VIRFVPLREARNVLARVEPGGNPRAAEKCCSPFYQDGYAPKREWTKADKDEAARPTRYIKAKILNEVGRCRYCGGRMHMVTAIPDTYEGYSGRPDGTRDVLDIACRGCGYK
jgi:hypothetical protein